MKKRTVSCVFQSLIAFGLLANGAFVEVNGSNLNGLPYGYNNTQGSNLWGYGNPRGNMGGGMGMGGMNVNPRGNMGGGMGMGGMNVNPNGNMGGGMGEHIQQQPKPYTPPISSSQDQNQKSAFSLFRELHDEELAFKVSAHELAAYIKEELAKIHSSLPSQEKKLLDRLIVYMEYAYSLQKDLEKEDKSHPKAMYTYYMPHDITQHIVDLSIAELFDQTELSTEHLGLFCNALYEMAGNPHGAKRLISLLLLKKTASYDFVPCAVPLKQKILVKNMESAGSPAYFQRDVRNPQLNKIAVNFKKYMKHFPIDAYYAKVRYNSDVITPEEDLACTLLHELTHAYHHFFTGIMGVPLDKVFSSQQEKNLFPTHRIGFFNDVSGFIYNSISSSNVNADKYDNYRKLLDSLYKGLHAFSEQQYTMDQYLPLVKKDSYDGRFAALGNRLNLETLHRLAADLIAEQIIAGKNYWRDSEELLTIFGAVPYLEKGKHKVIIIDRDNHVSYLARTRNKMTCFFHSPNPLGRLQERTQPNNGSVSEAKELEVPKIADLLDFLNESLPQHGKVNEIMFINNFTSKLKDIVDEKASKASTAEEGSTSINLYETMMIVNKGAQNPKPYKALFSNVETVNTRVPVSGMSYFQTKPKNVPIPSESKYKSSEKAPFPPRKPADQLRIDIVNGRYNDIREALESKDPTFIKQIVNDRAENGDTPLAVAIRYNNQEIMGLLLAHEANSDSDTNGALDWASDDLRKMLNNQTSIGLLHFGIGQDNIKYLKELLKKHDIDPKIVVNGTDSKGKTPLGFAVEKNNREIVKLLLEYDADPDSIVNQTDLPRKTPLILAVEKNSSEIVKLLLEYGADPDSITCPPETNSAIRDMIYIKTQANLLRSSITFGNDYNAIENILSGVKTSTMKNFLPKIVNDRDKNGKTPLVLAVEKNSSEIVKLLLEYGANPDSVKLYPPETNSAIIDMISIKSTANLLRSYITFGDDDGTKKSILRYKKEGLLPKIINDQDENGKTLLVLAVEKNSSEIVKLLLGNGADPYSIVNGTTLLDLAIKHGNKEIITLIKTYFTYY